MNDNVRKALQLAKENNDPAYARLTERYKERKAKKEIIKKHPEKIKELYGSYDDDDEI